MAISEDIGAQISAGSLRYIPFRSLGSVLVTLLVVELAANMSPEDYVNTGKMQDKDLTNPSVLMAWPIMKSLLATFFILPIINNYPQGLPSF